jgi:hypothetical protein
VPLDENLKKLSDAELRLHVTRVSALPRQHGVEYIMAVAVECRRRGWSRLEQCLLCAASELALHGEDWRP